MGDGVRFAGLGRGRGQILERGSRTGFGMGAGLFLGVDVGGRGSRSGFCLETGPTLKPISKHELDLELPF